MDANTYQDRRLELLEKMITDTNIRLGRLEKLGYIIVGLMVGVGILDVSKFVAAMGS